MQHIYIDTYYIQARLIGHGDDESHAKEQFRKAIERSHKSGEIFIKFPFIVIGELMNNLNHEELDPTKREQALNEFLDILKDEKVDLVPPKIDSLKMATDIKKEDRYLGVTDILIAAQALCDTNSSLLLTNDSKILESLVISRINKEMTEKEERVRKLKILPYLR